MKKAKWNICLKAIDPTKLNKLEEYFDIQIPSSWNLNKLNNLNILGDSDDDDANNDLKQFSNSYKQFLKSKRALVK